MTISIQNQGIRVGIAIAVFLVISAIVFPYLMSVDPPVLITVLLKPAGILGDLIGPFLPHGNIGTQEHPIYEGTPFDLILGFVLICVSIFFYSIVAYFATSLLARALRR